MNNEKLSAHIDDLIEEFGLENVEGEINKAKNSNKDTNRILTIICNEGVHHLPDEYKRGTLFVASKGSLDFSSRATVVREYTVILEKTIQKLMERPWETIYIIPFGPPTLSMLIKLIVYRITGIDSTDVMHIGKNKRVDLHFDVRTLITGGK